MGKIRLLIIEENRLLREGISAIFKTQQRLEVEAIAGDEDHHENKIRQIKPHVILLNASLQKRYSVEMVQWISEKFHETKIVVMSLSLLKSEILQFIDAGATGFILKEVPPLEYIKTIIAVATGETILPIDEPELLLPSILSHALAKEKGKIDREKSVQITEFELQLLQLISEGQSNHDIWKKLAIKPENVNLHLYKVKQKLYLFSHLESLRIMPQKPPFRNGE